MIGARDLAAAWCRLTWVTGAVVVMTGCTAAHVAPVTDSSIVSAPVEEVIDPPAEAASTVSMLDNDDVVVQPLAADGSVGSELARPDIQDPDPMNPAVVSLLDAANAHSRAGRHDRAATSLERALQIEPRNAWLWHRLALERLAQGQIGQAEQLANKSISFATGDTRLLGDNWALIAEARRRSGDLAGALDAETRAGQVRQGG